MTIDAIKQHIPGVAPLSGTAPGVTAGEVAGSGKSFAHEFAEAVKQVDQMQLQADQQIEDLVLKKGNVTPHEAMIALEKADIAFNLMTSIKSKIIRAYEEVLRTQV